MREDDAFAKRIITFASAEEIKSVTIHVNDYHHILSAQSQMLFDVVTTIDELRKGIYAYFLGKPIILRLNGFASEGRIAYIIYDNVWRAHCLDGPAIKYDSGEEQYWIDGKQYSISEWKRVKKLLVFK